MRTRPRSTRCPCGTQFVEGRCPPCDAIKASRKAATQARLRRREEVVDERVIGIDLGHIRRTVAQLTPENAAFTAAQSARARRGHRKAMRVGRGA